MKKTEAKPLPVLPAKNLSCYVLITCEEPLDGGEMPVNMTYHGDQTLISLLLQGAQSHFDNMEEGEATSSHSPILQLVD